MLLSALGQKFLKCCEPRSLNLSEGIIKMESSDDPKKNIRTAPSSSHHTYRRCLPYMRCQEVDVHAEGLPFVPATNGKRNINPCGMP